MIETPGGLEALEAIAHVSGLDGLFAGPSDLASSLGRPPRMDTDDAVVLDALRRIAECALKANIMAGLACETAAYAKRMLAEGYRLFVTRVGSAVADCCIEATAGTTRRMIAAPQSSLSSSGSDVFEALRDDIVFGRLNPRERLIEAGPGAPVPDTPGGGARGPAGARTSRPRGPPTQQGRLGPRSPHPSRSSISTPFGCC